MERVDRRIDTEKETKKENTVRVCRCNCEEGSVRVHRINKQKKSEDRSGCNEDQVKEEAPIGAWSVNEQQEHKADSRVKKSQEEPRRTKESCSQESSQVSSQESSLVSSLVNNQESNKQQLTKLTKPRSAVRE